MKIIFYYVDCCSGFLLIQTKFKAFLINTFITQSSACSALVSKIDEDRFA